MGVEHFKLYFNHENRVYYCGDTLRATVKMVVNSSIKIQKLTCIVKGKAETRWEKQSGNTTYIYTGKDPYFENNFILLQKPESQDLEMGPGEYNLEFSFTVPDKIPPTYEGKKGSIKYSIKAILERPWKLDKTTKELFVIKQLLDLNQDALINPNIKEPAIIQLEEEFCCCFNHGMITALVKLPYTGFVQNQRVLITIEIENSSNVGVNNLRFNLKKTDTFYTDYRGHKKKKEEKLLSGYIGSQVPAGSSKVICYDLCMPNIPFVNLRDCNIIDIDYILQFELVLSSGWTVTTPKELPITFGTIQLNDFNINSSKHEPPTYEESFM